MKKYGNLFEKSFGADELGIEIEKVSEVPGEGIKIEGPAGVYVLPSHGGYIEIGDETTEIKHGDLIYLEEGETATVRPKTFGLGSMALRISVIYRKRQ